MFCTPCIELIEQLFKECFIITPAVKIPAASKDQSLFQSFLEPVVTLLCITVFIRMSRLSFTALEAVMIGKTLIVSRKFLRIADLVNRAG